MKLLNAEDLANSIKKDIEKCQSIYFAVAWVTSNDIFKELAKAIDKVAIGVIGLNLHHTDPAYNRIHVNFRTMRNMGFQGYSRYIRQL